jgi:hypothetical protein
MLFIKPLFLKSVAKIQLFSETAKNKELKDVKVFILHFLTFVLSESLESRL